MDKGHRILIVEDDRQIATVLADTLRDEGYDIRWAANGREGLAILDHWVPDAIILDLMMPVMDGRSFRMAQCQRGPDIAALPVIILSGAREARSQAEALAAADAITKPFDLDDVVCTVARLFEPG